MEFMRIVILDLTNNDINPLAVDYCNVDDTPICMWIVARVFVLHEWKQRIVG